jgi:hypothetical protein
MSKITTNDCKVFLSVIYPDKKSSNWKRIRKFKDENGNVCREFNYLNDESVILVEKNSQLSVLLSKYQIETSIKENHNKTVVNDENSSSLPVTEGHSVSFTLFNDIHQKAAKKLVNAFVKPKEDPVEPDSSAKGFDAIPNLIQFSFLEDANGDETEYLEEIVRTMNVNAPMDNLSVFFIPTTVKSLCEHISPLVEPFLTVPLYESEEMTFKINNSDETLTVSDVFKRLSEAGFVYNPEGCALRSLFEQYQIVNIEPVIHTDDKTPILKKAFIAALKKDDASKLQQLVTDGLPLNLKVGGQSLLGKIVYENKLECLKYLLTLYPNTANAGNGASDQVWELVWWPNDCSCYFMANAAYDFTDANKTAHRNLVSTLVHHTTYFEKMTKRVNHELFSVACLESTLTYDRAYPVFKDFVKKAIDEYPATVSISKEMIEQLKHGFIIPPILELLAGSACTFGNKSVFEVVQAKIDEIGHDPKGYIDKINSYKSFLRKHGR